MNCLFRACSAAILSRIGVSVGGSSCYGFSVPPWKISCDYARIRTVNVEHLFPRLRVQCYSSRKGGGSKSRLKVEPKLVVMEDEKDAFFVVRKGDVVGVYKSLSECQAQVGSSICDPPVSVYKGYCMPKDTEEYLISCGLKNALYSIRAADLKMDLFGPLVTCPFQQPSHMKVETPGEDIPKKRSLEVLGAEVEAVGSTSISNDPLRKHLKFQSSGLSCILEFDGASKGNPGQAGAGAVLRADDGSLICRLREGLGVATNNAAEYRALILGMKYALKKGFTNIRVLGDSKLVCMQIQELWKVKNPNMSNLYNEAKKLKNQFLSFKISHVLRELNSEADAQANSAVCLADGQIEELA
ncbi:Ribonuclease H-like domain protein [Actinidia chinensis var. chinensis]|uniref:Ribonuclease H-like domain protein n=1 Tax=Actinidia chinensis var. chinensis TaxID=1590841 RepID=A0A2R6QR35_ACTCC|nr:Ribonuclease H-like domain protein [Actinidia chinensis var. chinensis]